MYVQCTLYSKQTISVHIGIWEYDCPLTNVHFRIETEISLYTPLLCSKVFNFRLSCCRFRQNTDKPSHFKFHCTKWFWSTDAGFSISGSAACLDKTLISVVTANFIVFDDKDGRYEDKFTDIILVDRSLQGRLVGLWYVFLKEIQICPAPQN